MGIRNNLKVLTKLSGEVCVCFFPRKPYVLIPAFQRCRVSKNPLDLFFADEVSPEDGPVRVEIATVVTVAVGEECGSKGLQNGLVVFDGGEGGVFD